ncbi:MAG TPA: hypothetical protein VI758_04580 [Bacteroidota bacterium]
MSRKNSRNVVAGLRQTDKRTWFDTVERFTREHPTSLLVGVLVVGLILALFLFDIKPSIGGDDTAYILQAHSLISKGILPVGFKSPGYPVLLAAFMLVTGMNVGWLKLTSLLFYLASLASCFSIFRRRLEPMLFFLVMVLCALSLLVLEYSHQTYSEMAYLLIELWTIHFFWRREEDPARHGVRGIFIIALLSMAGFYVRAIGATLPLAIGLWFLTQKQWKTALYFGAFCVLLYIPWKVAEFSQGIVLMGQASDVMMINPYNPALGRETVGGFVTRFLSNMIVHLNYMFPRALSLPYGEYLGVADGTLFPNSMAFLGVLFSTVLLVGIWRALRRGPKEIRFLALYVVVYLVSIWLALQTLYATPRMLVPMVPFLLLLFLVGVYEVLHRMLSTSQNRTPAFKGWFVFIGVCLLVSNVASVGGAVDDNLPVLKANLRGDEFAGFSPDWVNYLKASQWIANNLPKDSTGVICRKPELFQIYSGGFYAYGTYTVESTIPDTIVDHWKSWKMTHLLYDNFQWSGTLRRYVQPVAEKFPRMFELIHQEGVEYPSYVYRLNYAVVDSVRAKKELVH